MQTNSASRIEPAILQKEINKYYPGIGIFLIPTILTRSDEVKNTPVRYGNSANKNTVSSLGNINLGKTISLPIPKYITVPYKKKMIPVGTIFYVAFKAEDGREPFIIGMDLGG